MQTQNLFRGIAINSAMALFIRCLGIPLFYVNNVIIARLWGAELLGTLMIATSILVTLTSICGLGLPTGLLRFVAKLDLKGDIAGVRKISLQTSGFVFILSIIISLGLYWSRDWLSLYFKAPYLKLLIVFLALSFPFEATIPLLRETLRGQGLVQWPTFQQFTFSPLIVLLVVSLLLVINQRGIFLYKTAILGWAILLSTILSWLLLAIRFFYYNRRFSHTCQAESIMDLLRFSLPLFLNTLIALPIGILDSIILGLYSSTQDVAYYGAAARIVPVISLPIVAVNSIVPQMFAHFYERGDLQGLMEVARTTARWMYFWAFPAVLLIIILGEEFLSMFGREFSKAYLVLIILAFGQLANVAAGSCGSILVMTGNQWLLFIIGTGTAIFSLGIMVLLTSAFGIYGMAVASTLGLSTLNFSMALTVWRKLHVKSYGFRLLWVNLAGITSISLFFLSKAYIGVYGGVVIFIFFYLVMMAKEIKNLFKILHMAFAL